MKIDIDDNGARRGIGYTIRVYSDERAGTLAERLDILQEELLASGHSLSMMRYVGKDSDGSVVFEGPVFSPHER